MSTKQPVTKSRPRRMWLRVVLSILAVLVVIAGVVLAVAWSKWRQWQTEPTYWTEHQAFIEQTPQPQLRLLAESAEQQMLDSVSDAAPAADGSRMVAVSREQLNAWLHDRLPAWLAHQGVAMPPGVSEFMATTEGDHLVVAFRLDTPQVKQVVSAVFAVNLSEDGQLNTRLTELRGGSLGVDPRHFIGRIPDNVDPQARKALEWMTTGRTIPAVFPHPTDNRRRIRIQGIELHKDGLRLKIRHEAGGEGG